MPHGDAVAPPQLPGDTPVVDVVEPVEPSLLKPLRDDLELSALHSLHSTVRHAPRLDEPLRADEGLDDLPPALGPGHALGVGLGLDCNAHLFEVRPELLARFESVHPLVLAAKVVECSVAVHDIDVLQIMPLSNLIVIRIVPRRDLQASRPKLHVHIVVGDDRNLPVLRGNHDRLSNKMLVTLVLGVHAHGSVAQDGLGARRRHGEVLIRPLDRVFEVVQLALLLRVLHLEVRHRRLEVGAPVYHVVSTVDQPLVVQLNKGLGGRARQPVVHGEPLPGPVGRGPEAPHLLGDVPTLLLLPLPHPLQELLPANLEPGGAFLVEAALYQELCGNASVVRARKVQGRPAPHPVEPGHNVLEGDKHGVPHVQPPGDVWGGHREDVAPLLALLILCGLEVPRLLPPLVDGLLDRTRVVLGGHLPIRHNIGGPSHAAEASQNLGVPPPPQVQSLEGQPGQHSRLGSLHGRGGSAAGEEGRGGGRGGETPAEAEVGGGRRGIGGGEGAMEVCHAPDVAGVGADTSVCNV
mmetsp:Transcript_9183/g.21424  ORF Transcript_9183/g.21424 Transcript_9183/m.21424 type:complete len:522 (+) Transcript_9183:1636-3201(+)